MWKKGRAGQSSGAISALYADHLNNHAQPVSIFLSIARVPLPFVPTWLLNIAGFSSMMPATTDASASSSDSDNDGDSDGDGRDSLAGFVVGFLYDNEVHVFASYQWDSLVRFEIEYDGGSNAHANDEGKEVLYLSFVNTDYNKKLDIEIHKPVQINGLKRRKKIPLV